MKLIFVRSLNPFFESSASANRYEGLIRGLLNAGVKVEIYITGGYSSFEEIAQAKKHATENLKFTYLVLWVNFQNVWFNRLSKYILTPIKRCFVSVKLRSKLRRTKSNIVWLSNNPDILSNYLKVKKDLKSTTLIELNEYNDLFENANGLGRLQYRQALREDRIFKKAVGEIDLFAVMTETLLSHYKPMAKPTAKFIHLPMTVDFDRFANQTEEASMTWSKPYIAYTGTFNNEKDGVDVLIKSFATITQKFPDLRLYMAGFYHPDMDTQKRLIKELGLEDKVIYTGVLHKKEIPGFLQGAELLVMSRPDSRQAQGGFPTKLGEYMATGHPVCVTKVGEIPNYLNDNESAFLAEPGNVSSFAEAMLKALSDKENAVKVGQNGKKIAFENFSASVQSSRLFEFIKINL